MTDKKFSWVNTHKQITEYLGTKENSQPELIGLLKSVGISPFNDKDNSGKHNIELDEIDPFTFYCYIYKYGSKRRLAFLQAIAKKLNISVPNDEKGLPSAQAQKVWLFPYKTERTNNEVSRLWAFFKKAVENRLENADFEDVLSIRSTGKTKLTEALFYINPEKYLPINGPTKPYIKEELGIDPKFNTYYEYMEILKKIKTKTNIPFYELSYEAWKWNDARKKVNYWIFQGNPKVFDFKTALRQGILTDWTVSAHKDKINVGDKVILWITGDKSGCYALGRIASKPYLKSSSPDDHLWKEEDKSELKVAIKITHNLVDAPILKEKVDIIDELTELKVGNQGTNFTATEEEFETLHQLANNISKRKYWLYAPGENASKWDEFYTLGIIGLGWDELGDLKDYSTKKEIVSRLQKLENTKGSKKNDATANFEFKNVLSTGDIIIPKKGRKEYLGYGIVDSDYFYDADRNSYQKCRKVKWKKKGVWSEESGDIVLKTLTDITKYPDYVEKLKKLIGIEDGKNSIKIDNTKMNYPLNTIFYGPPGTGKTYYTVLRAAEIIENRKIESYEEAFQIFKSNLHDRIEFITFHQNYSYEDFIQGLRPDTENDKELTFERKDGVFKIIADKALRNIIESEQPGIAKKSFEEVFNQFITPLTEGETEEIEVKMKKVSYFITATTNKSVDFRKASGATAHTLSIATLKKMYEAESVLNIQGMASYYSPLLDKLLKIGKDSKGSKEEIKRKNYVIVIDEINRANISRVFGELITLIEPDKRFDAAIPIEARLPSGDPFIVPSNLYMIGTMNTADKSIALLDIALRRRFEFESMYPRYEIEDCEIYDVDILQKINEQIIKSKGHDFQIGHAYFMGENKDLVQRMNKKVIPLLLEYYMNDEKEVKGILSKAGLKIEENTWPIRITGSYD